HSHPPPLPPFSPPRRSSDLSARPRTAPTRPAPIMPIPSRLACPIASVVRGSSTLMSTFLRVRRVEHNREPRGHLAAGWLLRWAEDRKSTRLNSSHVSISYAV